MVRTIAAAVSLIISIGAISSAGAQSSCESIFKSGSAKSPETLRNEFPFRKFRPSLSSKPDISVYRFSGLKSFQQARSANYNSEGKEFAMNGNVRELMKHGYREDESVISGLQDFPLQKMTETGYITAQEAKMFNSLGSGLHPGQVNFFDVTRTATREELKQYPPEILASRIANEHSDTYFDNLTRVRTATLWSVGGQIIDPKTRKAKPVALPWEKEDARKGQQLDRTKYKHVWEWGRAAQDIPDEIGAVYSANAAMNYIELMAHGGKLDDAYVMFHSFDKVNTRLYLAEHPNSTYPAGWKDPNDSLFIVPLKDMLKKYPPSKFSSRVANIIRMSNGKIGELEALQLLMQTRLLRWEEFDLMGVQNQINPIIISDASQGWVLNLWMSISKHGLNEREIDQMMNYLVAVGPTLQTHNINNKYANAVDSLGTAYTYRNENAVEISNLDPGAAQRDPNYVMSVVFEGYVNYLNRLSQNIQKARPHLSRHDANNEAIGLLVKHKIKFGVSTADEVVRSQAKKLAPAVERMQPGTQGTPDKDTLASHPYWFKDAHMYMFSMEQILSWSRAHTQYFMNSPYQLRQGYWWSQYFLSQVDLL